VGSNAVCGTVGALTAPTVNACKPQLPGSPEWPPRLLSIIPAAPIPQIIGFYQTNFVAADLTLQTEVINVRNSTPGVSINVGAAQNALTVNVPVPPQP
jgi:hypothetical protein